MLLVLHAGRQPHRHKLVVAGNHDLTFDPDFYNSPQGHARWHKKCGKQDVPAEGAAALLTNARVLQSEAIEIEGVRFYGESRHPIIPRMQMAWQRPPEDLDAVWDVVPATPPIDVLLSHCPPYGVLDRLFVGKRVGDPALRRAVERIRPQFHCFGHIHEQYGVQQAKGGSGPLANTTFFNATSVSLTRQLGAGRAIVFDVVPREKVE